MSEIAEEKKPTKKKTAVAKPPVRVLVYSTATYPIPLKLKSGSLMLAPNQQIPIDPSDLPGELPKNVRTVNLKN